MEAGTGVKVRSGYEKKCVEYFEKNHIRFSYEPLILLEGRQYRPDFFLPDLNLFVEICGYRHMPHYRDRMEFKRRLYEKHNLRAVFISYSGRGSLEKLLETALRDFNQTA